MLGQKISYQGFLILTGLVDVSSSFRQLQTDGRNGHAKSSTVVQHFPFFSQLLQKFMSFWPDLDCSSYDALKSFCIQKGRQDRQPSRMRQALAGSAGKWEWLWRNVSPQHRLESESGYPRATEWGRVQLQREGNVAAAQSLWRDGAESRL